MFTIKLYGDNGFRQVVRSAESFTILRGLENGEAEITLHQKGGQDDSRVDIKHGPNPDGFPSVFERAIIENAAGRTTEMIGLRPINSTPATAPLRQVPM